MILLISICKNHLHELEFVKPIEDILTANKIPYSTKHYKKLSQQDINKAEKIIVCGTSLYDNSFLKDLKEFSWIKQCKKPILGICGGSHIIGMLLGQRLKKQMEIGLKDINLSKEFLGIKGKISVYHLHQLAALPEIFHKDNLYAVLFHPEVRNKEMIVNFTLL